MSLKALTRPYPVAIAGTPISFAFDAPTQIFRLQYRNSGAGSALRNKETVIVLPTSFYPKGYRVEVSGAKVTSTAGAKFLQLVTEGDPEKISVSIFPNR
jgi:endoglycosylceramidase